MARSGKMLKTNRAFAAKNLNPLSSMFFYRELIKGGPVKYVAPEDRDVWFCMCKHTSHRPFCDGSHRHPDIQELKLEGKFNLWDPTSDVKVDKTVFREDDISDEDLLYGDLEDEKTKK